MATPTVGVTCSYTHDKHLLVYGVILLVVAALLLNYSRKLSHRSWKKWTMIVLALAALAFAFAVVLSYFTYQACLT